MRFAFVIASRFAVALLKKFDVSKERRKIELEQQSKPRNNRTQSCNCKLFAFLLVDFGKSLRVAKSAEIKSKITFQSINALQYQLLCFVCKNSDEATKWLFRCPSSSSQPVILKTAYRALLLFEESLICKTEAQANASALNVVDLASCAKMKSQEQDAAKFRLAKPANEKLEEKWNC